MEVSSQLHASTTLSPGWVPGNHWSWGWLCLNVDMDGVEKRRNLCPSRESKPGRPALKSSHYNDWAKHSQLNSMEQSFKLESNSDSVKKISAFIEPELSLSCSQQSAADPYPESDESSTHFSNLCP